MLLDVPGEPPTAPDPPAPEFCPVVKTPETIETDGVVTAGAPEVLPPSPPAPANAFSVMPVPVIWLFPPAVPAFPVVPPPTPPGPPAPTVTDNVAGNKSVVVENSVTAPAAPPEPPETVTPAADPPAPPPPPPAVIRIETRRGDDGLGFVQV